MPDCGGQMRIIETFRRGQNRNPAHHPERPPHDEMHATNQRLFLNGNRVQR
jgi:hypothetical protein